MHYHRAWSSKWGDDLEWLKVGWHLLMVMPNSLIKYAALDEETKDFSHTCLSDQCLQLKSRTKFWL